MVLNERALELLTYLMNGLISGSCHIDCPLAAVEERDGLEKAVGAIIGGFMTLPESQQKRMILEFMQQYTETYEQQRAR